MENSVSKTVHVLVAVIMVLMLGLCPSANMQTNLPFDGNNRIDGVVTV